MTSKRGFTLVELMFVTAITAVIVGALGGLFVFVGTRASQAIAKNGLLLQSQALSDEFEATFAQAQDCKLVVIRGGLSGIKCTLPTQGTDADADGVIDKFGAEWVGPTGREGYGSGRRVWFFMSDNTGNPNSIKPSGGLMWRAWRNDDSLPTIGDIDSRFAFYYGNTSKPRWNFIDSVAFTIGANGTVTYTIVSNKLRRAERQAGAGEATANYESFRMKRTVVCKNWRK